MRTPDDDDHVALPRQLNSRGLALFGRLANRIDEADFRSGKTPLDQRNHVPHPVNRLGRLRGDAKTLAFSERSHVSVAQHHIVFGQVLRQTANLDMVALANDDRVIAFLLEPGHHAMREVDEWAGCLNDVQPSRPDPIHRSLRSPVRGDHHRWRGDGRRIVLDADASLCQRVHDCFVVYQLAEDSQRPGFGLLQGQRNGVAHAEAHSQVFCANDLHFTFGFVLQS